MNSSPTIGYCGLSYIFWPIIQLLMTLVLSVVLIISVMVIWSLTRLVRKIFRKATRRHLYIPVDAEVYFRSFSIFPPGPNISVAYNCCGSFYDNRLMTNLDTALHAVRMQRIRLWVDPDYPRDAVIDQIES